MSRAALRLCFGGMSAASSATCGSSPSAVMWSWREAAGPATLSEGPASRQTRLVRGGPGVYVSSGAEWDIVRVLFPLSRRSRGEGIPGLCALCSGSKPNKSGKVVKVCKPDLTNAVAVNLYLNLYLSRTLKGAQARAWKCLPHIS